MVKICNDGFDENFIEEHRNLYSIAYTQNMLSGRYKNLIIWYLKTEGKRFGEIKKFFANISQGSLTKQLKELESDGILNREVYAEVPPKVIYSLTDKGKDILPLIDLMEKYGRMYGDK
ncbi:TPA: winged helix-turn-helix transcriptional regulator [Staphylococcus aureus]